MIYFVVRIAYSVLADKDAQYTVRNTVEASAEALEFNFPQASNHFTENKRGRPKSPSC